MSNWTTMFMQDANSMIMEFFIIFHDLAMSIIIMIMFMITYLFILLMFNKLNNKFLLNNQLMEIIWTVIPMLILIFLAFPSLKILYLTDEMIKPSLTIKIIGHQWYWSYEYTNFFYIEFDSYMIKNSEEFNLFRLLDVDNRMVIPFMQSIRLLITSIDVIHSWTIPSLGIKMDAIPGRLNQTHLISNFPTLLFGQCSEICGMNHSFMPIVVESTHKYHFYHWTKNLM